MSKISVVIPIYNVERFIREALESVVKQTLKDVEIICIDDCSTDKSLEIVKEFALKDNRILVIENKTNQGEIIAKYKGAQMAKGDYIGTLDPDDYLPPNYYETLYNEAVINNADVAICNIKRIKENGNLIKNKLIKVTNENKCIKFNETYINKLNPGTPNKIIKKEIFEHAMNFKDRDIWKDYYQYWRGFTKFTPRVCFVEDVFYYYRKRNGSITRSKASKKEKLKSLLKTIELILSYLVKEEIYENYKEYFWDDAFLRIKKCCTFYFNYQKSYNKIKEIIKNYQINENDILKHKRLSFF